MADPTASDWAAHILGHRGTTDDGCPWCITARSTSEEPFVLDRTENPHPRMLAGALAARAAAVDSLGVDGSASYWRGYLTAMADATGCEPAELEAWMDRHA